MDWEKIETTLNNEAGLRICPICGTPFEPYHSRQKTCGRDECKKAYRSEATKLREAERRAENPEEYRKSKNRTARKYRQKKKTIYTRESQLKTLSKQWEKQLEFDSKIAEYGLEYGKRSAEKTLANIPKINVELNEKEKNNE